MYLLQLVGVKARSRLVENQYLWVVDKGLRQTDTLTITFGKLRDTFVSHKRLYATIGHRRCPVLGHVGMLHTVLDVTGLEVKVGDTARLDLNPLLMKGLDVELR